MLFHRFAFNRFQFDESDTGHCARIGLWLLPIMPTQSMDQLEEFHLGLETEMN